MPELAHTAPVAYTITPHDLHAHLYHVELRIANPAAAQTVWLPVWIPGSYLVREFARHLQRLRATQNGQPIAVTQLSKNTWQLGCEVGQGAVTLQYEAYAFDNSVRTAWLDADRAFFNPTSLCLCVQGQEGESHDLNLPAPAWPATWSLATGLLPAQEDAVAGNGFGTYRAAHYDELADSPVEAGNFWSGAFEAAGVPHRFMVAGAGPGFDGERLLADTQAICEAQMRFWHPDGSAPRHQRYVFMLNAVHNGYGGLEHRHSTALICSREDLPRKGAQKQPKGYETLLGLISHEYFHTWNVKRMRPAEFARYDYQQENYTQLLWFFEGFTSYYDDLLLRRAGLLTDEGYLKVLAKTITQVAQTPGSQVQSVAQASFDAWVKYYRQDENTLNSTVSYYTKGALVALCLDLRLRAEGKTTLDDVMRALWQHSSGGPITEQDVLDTLQRLGGRSYEGELRQWVHSTEPLPLAELLAVHGVELAHAKPTWAQRLGITVAQEGGIHIRRVLRHSPAEKAGLNVNDEWLAVEVDGSAWRLKKLDELSQYLTDEEASADIALLVARDARLLRLPLTLAPAAQTHGDAELSLKNQDAVAAWLQGPSA